MTEPSPPEGPPEGPSLFADSIAKLFDAPAGDSSTALKAAVPDYLTSERGGAAEGRVRDAFESARAQSEWDAMADTVSALTRLGSSRPEALGLARDLFGPELAAVLVRRLVEASPDAREDRVGVLVQLGGDAPRAVAGALHDSRDTDARQALLKAMARVGSRAPGVLEEMVQDARWFVVRDGVTVLGETGGDVALQHLTGTVVHEDPRIRLATVLSLQKIKDEGAALLILGRLEDDDPSVRVAAAHAVGTLGLERGLRALLALLDREADDEVTVAICRALGRLGDPSAVSALEKRATGSLFSKPPTLIRVAAYQGLAAIGTPHAMRLLVQAETDRDPTVRAAVAEARRIRES